MVSGQSYLSKVNGRLALLFLEVFLPEYERLTAPQ